VAANDYLSELKNWRQEADEVYRQPRSWLTLAGLYWLETGDNRFGTAADNDIALPEGSATAHIGHFAFDGESVRAVIAPGVEAMVEGEPVDEVDMQPDVSGEPTYLYTGRLILVAIVRGERFGIRVWDTEHPALQAFTGRTWFPPDEAYRLQARFEPYDPPHKTHFANMVGQEIEVEIAGALVFELHGQQHQLEALPVSEGLFVVFKDATSQTSTYPAGRYLVTDEPEDGKVVLDFNKAYNPPCAVTPYATCTLPPPQNVLTIAIEAGEKYHGEH